MFEENYSEEEVEDSDHEDESETAENGDQLEQRLYRYLDYPIIIIASLTLIKYDSFHVKLPCQFMLCFRLIQFVERIFAV